MAMQQTSTPPKTKRLGRFPQSIRKVVIITSIIFFLITGVIGAIGIWQNWGIVYNLIFLILAVTSVIIGVLAFWSSTKPTEVGTPSSYSFTQQTPQAPVQVNIYNNAGHHAESQYFPSQVINNPNNDAPRSHNTNSNASSTNAPGVNLPISLPPLPALPGGHTDNVPLDIAQKKSIVRLSGRERLELTTALLDAYPTLEDFDMMLQVNFDKSLNAFVDIHQNFRNVIFHFTGKTQAEGWTEALIIAAHEANSGNEILKNCYDKYIQKRNVQASGQNTVAEGKQPGARRAADKSTGDEYNSSRTVESGNSATILVAPLEQGRQQPTDQAMQLSHETKESSERISLLDREERLAAVLSSQVLAMDRAADSQRDREAAKSTIQGKIATKDFDVFLCYNSKDKAEVKEIGEQLKEQGILPWLDEWELPPGVPWQRLLEKQIGQIKTAAVFVGKGGIGPWQQMEVEAFLRKFVNRRSPVIPVILATAPRDKKPRLPVFLAGMGWVDFRVNNPNPMKLLLWGITGRRDDF